MHQHRLEEQTRMVEYLKATNAPVTNAPVSSLGRFDTQNRSPSPVAENRPECSPGQLTPTTADIPIAGHIHTAMIRMHINMFIYTAYSYKGGYSDSRSNVHAAASARIYKCIC